MHGMSHCMYVLSPSCVQAMHVLHDTMHTNTLHFVVTAGTQGRPVVDQPQAAVTDVVAPPSRHSVYSAKKRTALDSPAIMTPAARHVRPGVEEPLQESAHPLSTVSSQSLVQALIAGADPTLATRRRGKRRASTGGKVSVTAPASPAATVTATGARVTVAATPPAATSATVTATGGNVTVASPTISIPPVTATQARAIVRAYRKTVRSPGHKKNDTAARAAVRESQEVRERERPANAATQRATYARHQSAAAAVRVAAAPIPQEPLSVDMVTVPAAEQLDDHEGNVDTALLLFHYNIQDHVLRAENIPTLAEAPELGEAWSSREDANLDSVDLRPLWDDIAAHAVTTEQSAAFVKQWIEHMSPDNPLLACATCGIRAITASPDEDFPVVLLDSLPALLLSDIQKQNWDSLGDYKAVKSVYQSKLGPLLYHVHPELVQVLPASVVTVGRAGGSKHGVTVSTSTLSGSGSMSTVTADDPRVEVIHCCASCYKSLRAGKLPKYSIAAGIDYGSIRRVGLTKLSTLQWYCIAQCLVYCVVIKLKSVGDGKWKAAVGSEQSALLGHVLCKAHDGAQQMSVALPRLLYVDLQSMFQVVWVGTKGERDRKMAAILAYSELRADAKPMLDHFHMLTKTHPMYAHYTVPHIATVAPMMITLKQAVIENTLIIDEPLALEVEKQIGSDVAGVRLHSSDKGEHGFVQESEYAAAVATDGVGVPAVSNILANPVLGDVGDDTSMCDLQSEHQELSGRDVVAGGLSSGADDASTVPGGRDTASTGAALPTATFVCTVSTGLNVLAVSAQPVAAACAPAAAPAQVVLHSMNGPLVGNGQTGTVVAADVSVHCDPVSRVLSSVTGSQFTGIAGASPGSGNNVSSTITAVSTDLSVSVTSTGASVFVATAVSVAVSQCVASACVPVLAASDPLVAVANVPIAASIHSEIDRRDCPVVSNGPLDAILDAGLTVCNDQLLLGQDVGATVPSTGGDDTSIVGSARDTASTEPAAVSERLSQVCLPALVASGHIDTTADAVTASAVDPVQDISDAGVLRHSSAGVHLLSCTDAAVFGNGPGTASTDSGIRAGVQFGAASMSVSESDDAVSGDTVIADSSLVVDFNAIGLSSPEAFMRQAVELVANTVRPRGAGDGPASVKISHTASGFPNEYSEMKDIMHGTFVGQFPLGTGIVTSGTVPVKHVEHMLTQFTCAFAHCPQLLYYIFSCLVRHTANKAVAARVRANKEAFKEFTDAMDDPGFYEKCCRATADPKSDDAKDIMRLIDTYMSICGAKVPFSPLERKAVKGSTTALGQVYAEPVVWGTVAYDDAHNASCVRLSCFTVSNVVFPATDDGLTEALQKQSKKFLEVPIQNIDLQRLVAENPVAAALTFNRILQAVMKILLRVTLEVAVKRTKPLNVKDNKGVFGLLKALKAVIEAAARGSLHAHLILWSVFGPRLFRRVAAYRGLRDLVASVLDTMFQAQLPPACHLAGMVRRHLHIAAIPGSYTDSPLPCGPVGCSAEANLQCKCAFDARVCMNADRTQVHVEHRQTCQRHGEEHTRCRLAMPRALLEHTGVVQLRQVEHEFELQKDGVTKANRVEQMEFVEEEDKSWGLDRDYTRNPLPEPDSRVLYWATRRPFIELSDVDWTDAAGQWPTYLRTFVDGMNDFQRAKMHAVLSQRNCTITEFNATMLAVLSCNIAMEMLGSTSQAQGALNYLSDYVSKGPTDIQHSMILFHEAVKHSMEYKSNAEDAAMPERRGKLVLTRFLNNYFRQHEISAPQVAACIIGVRADMCSVKQVWVFVWSAVQLARSLRVSTVAGAGGAAAADVPDPLPDELTAGTTVGIVNIPGRQPVLVPQEELYRNRGCQARFLNLQEFACVVTRVVLKQGGDGSNAGNVDSDSESGSDSDGDTQRTAADGSVTQDAAASGSVSGRKRIGRNRNKVLRLHPDYHLYDVLGLSVNSKQLSPYMTGVPPTPPGPPPSAESGLLEPWQEVADLFAEAILTAFKPWDWQTRMPVGEPKFAHLCSFMRDLEHGTDGRGATFVDRSRASLIYNWIHMGTVDGSHKWMLRQWRMRAATVLTKKTLGVSLDAPAFSKKGTSETVPTYSDGANDAEDAAQLALAREAAECISSIHDLVGPVEKDNTAHAAHLAEVAEHSRECVASLNRLFGDLSSTPVGTAETRPAHMHDKLSGVVLTTTLILSVLAAIERPMPVVPVADIAAPVAIPAQPTPAGSMPACSSRDSVAPADRQLNAGQQEFIDAMMPYMRLVAGWKAKPAVTRGPRPVAPQFFLHGGPGTGKSFVLNRLVQVGQSLGVVVDCMTYTNIAAKALPTGTQTINTGLRLSHNAVQGRQDAPKGHAKQSLYNKWRHVDIVIVDEASMVGPILLGVIVERLSIVLDTPEVAGGLCLVLAGGQ